jgi:hypothetical protein
MAIYSIHFFCNECSEVHPVGISLSLDDGPAERASIGDTYAGKALPPQIALLSNNTLTCPKTQRLTLQNNNNQVFLVPIA